MVFFTTLLRECAAPLLLSVLIFKWDRRTDTVKKLNPVMIISIIFGLVNFFLTARSGLSIITESDLFFVGVRLLFRAALQLITYVEIGKLANLTQDYFEQKKLRNNLFTAGRTVPSLALNNQMPYGMGQAYSNMSSSNSLSNQPMKKNNTWIVVTSIFSLIYLVVWFAYRADSTSAQSSSGLFDLLFSFLGNFLTVAGIPLLLSFLLLGWDRRWRIIKRPNVLMVISIICGSLLFLLSLFDTRNTVYFFNYTALILELYSLFGLILKIITLVEIGQLAELEEDYFALQRSNNNQFSWDGAAPYPVNNQIPLNMRQGYPMPPNSPQNYAQPNPNMPPTNTNPPQPNPNIVPPMNTNPSQPNPNIVPPIDSNYNQ